VAEVLDAGAYPGFVPVTRTAIRFPFWALVRVRVALTRCLMTFPPAYQA
jgi:hypothetical protein